MTPAEDYAAKRLEAESLIRQHAPERLQDQLIALLRPAIALTATRTDDAHIPIGTSKFGGAPDVPSDFVWPMWNGKPLGFLAQINLEEVAPFDVDGLLPKSGLLLFFFNWSDWSGTGEDLCRIFHFAQQPFSRSFREVECEVFVPSQKIAIEPYLDVDFPLSPTSSFSAENLLELRSPQQSNWSLKLHRPESLMKILGYSDDVYGSTRANVNYRDDDLDHMPWQLLLQINVEDISDDDFGDAVLVYFMIPTEDLLRREFHKARFCVGAA